jgi:formylglycine-generating enzyme required for sulfatase activity
MVETQPECPLTDYQAFLKKLNENLNILREREAKYGGNAPLELLYQIGDHRQAIALTKQAIEGELNEAEWRAALKPLLVAIDSRSDEAASSVTFGDVYGDIHFVVQIVQQSGGPPPPARNLPAQLAALQHALPTLDPVNKMATQGVIAKLAQALADLPAYEQSYRKRVRERYAADAPYYIALAGETSEVVPLRAEATAPRSALRRRQRAMAEYCEWIQSEREIRRVKLNTLREGVDKYPCLILLGEPGCGKTTALENLAYQLADEPDRLPVPLRLSEFRPGLTLEEFIVQGWAGSTQAGHWGAPELAANLAGYLEAGRLLFFFDALNEMPYEGYAERAQALRSFIDQWAARGNRFLVTCRVLDYGQELSGLQRVEVQPLNDSQIKAFLQNELPETWPTLWNVLIEGAADPQSKIQNPPEVRTAKSKIIELARNPYLLTMMIDIFAEDGQLGQNRAGLMSRFTQILLGWAKDKCAPAEWLEAETLRESLSVLAFEMQARAGSGAMVEMSKIKAVLPERVQPDPLWPPRPAPPDQVLTLAASAHLIELPVDRSSMRFYHQLLQEYFAAQQLLKRLSTDLTGLEKLWRWPWLETEMPLWVRPEGNHDPLPPPPPTGWEETTILAAGLATENDDQWVRSLLQVNPVLAGRCLYEGQAKVAKATRRIVIDALLLTLARPEVALRVRIAAGETLGYLGDPRLGEMVTIPAGEFWMGDDNSGYDNEKPRHKLFLPEYRIGQYPVTHAEYKRFIEAGGYKHKRWWTEAGWRKKEKPRRQVRPWTEPRFWRDAHFNKPNQPVVGLSWYETMAYCHWLSAETGQRYRLPTEAEWEKAARGLDGRRYPWGNLFETGRLNVNEGEQVVEATIPVGIYPTGDSPFGAFDCTGNVWEWGATQGGKRYPYDTTEDEWARGYLEGENGRALRGGSWLNDRDLARCAFRGRDDPYYSDLNIGFRVVSPIW